MKNYTDEELEDISLRNCYQNHLGKVLRKYQWDNLKLQISLYFPDNVNDKEFLKNIAEIKRKSPNWQIDSIGFKLLQDELKNIPRTGMDGASLYRLVKKLCRYKATNRTIHQWFYDVAKTCDLSKNYTKEQVTDICIKAVTSRPRGIRR